jgi:DNA-binding NarL/FixJ family response regulator
VCIKILLAYDNNMLTEMRKYLAQERSIEIVREARDFSTAIQLAVHAKADILLIDLDLLEKGNFERDFVRAHLRLVPCTIAVTLAINTAAKALAASYGVQALLDERNLHRNMIPAITNCHSHFKPEKAQLDGAHQPSIATALKSQQ